MTYRELLTRNADFRRLWSGQVVSEIGDWLNNIAVLALAIELAGAERQGRVIAVYALARHLPLFVFGPVAGVVVDRTDRRRVMIAADLARAVLALGFLLAQAYSSLPVIYAVGASLFSASAFFNAAKRASIPNLCAGGDELPAANSLSASTTAATIAVGSACGGLVATFFGRDIVFVLNAATFLASAVIIGRISPLAVGGLRRRRAAGEQSRVEANDSPFEENDLSVMSVPAPSAFGWGESVVRRRSSAVEASAVRRAFAEFRAGLRYVRGDGVLAAVFVVAACWGLGNGAARALYSIFGARLGEGAAAGWLARPKDFGISVLFVAMGLGGVLGAPLARRFNSAPDGLGARMGRSLCADGCALFVFSLTPGLWWAAPVLILREMNFAVWWTAQQTLLMRRTADAYAGRVFATHETVTTLTMVGSIYLAGAAADRFGIRLVAAGGGSVIALSGLLWFALRPRRGAAERGPELTAGPTPRDSY